MLKILPIKRWFLSEKNSTASSEFMLAEEITRSTLEEFTSTVGMPIGIDPSNEKFIGNKRKGRVGFLLCSDEKPDYSTFGDLPVSFGDSKSVASDLCSLSLCDYNIGPPSSFGTWLSWHGQVPRLQIGRDTIIESIDQFSICSEC